MSATICLDECGCTGDDLLGREQPVFVVITHDYSLAECDELKKTFFPNNRPNELKHKQLQRRASGRACVLALLSAIMQLGKR